MVRGHGFLYRGGELSGIGVMRGEEYGVFGEGGFLELAVQLLPGIGMDRVRMEVFERGGNIRESRDWDSVLQQMGCDADAIFCARDSVSSAKGGERDGEISTKTRLRVP